MEIASVESTSYQDIVKWNAVYGGSSNAEDNTYASATPSGKIELNISNKAILGKLRPGKKYYVDFTEIPDPAPAV